MYDNQCSVKCCQTFEWRVIATPVPHYCCVMYSKTESQHYMEVMFIKKQILFRFTFFYIVAYFLIDTSFITNHFFASQTTQNCWNKMRWHGWHFPCCSGLEFTIWLIIKTRIPIFYQNDELQTFHRDSENRLLGQYLLASQAKQL